MNENNDAFMKCQTKKHISAYRITHHIGTNGIEQGYT